eukprot:gene5286-5821_t
MNGFEAIYCYFKSFPVTGWPKGTFVIFTFIPIGGSDRTSAGTKDHSQSDTKTLLVVAYLLQKILSVVSASDWLPVAFPQKSPPLDT